MGKHFTVIQVISKQNLCKVRLALICFAVCKQSFNNGLASHSSLPHGLNVLGLQILIRISSVQQLAVVLVHRTIGIQCIHRGNIIPCQQHQSMVEKCY